MVENISSASHGVPLGVQGLPNPHCGTPMNTISASPDPTSQSIIVAEPPPPPPIYSRGPGSPSGDTTASPTYEFDIEEARVLPPPSYSDATKGSDGTPVPKKAKKQWKVCGIIVTVKGISTVIAIVMTLGVIVGGILAYKLTDSDPPTPANDNISNTSNSADASPSNSSYANDPRLGPFPIISSGSFELVASDPLSTASICNSYAALWYCPPSKTFSWNVDFQPVAFDSNMNILSTWSNSSLNSYFGSNPPADYTPYITLAQNIRDVGIGILVTDPSAEILAPYLFSSIAPDNFTNQPVGFDVTANYTVSVTVARNVTLTFPDIPDDMAKVFAGTWNCVYGNVTLAAKFAATGYGGLHITELSETAEGNGECRPVGLSGGNDTIVVGTSRGGNKCSCNWTGT
ncbi:hypothetical protein RUND412_008452 [Rhizina undulata]